MKYEKNIYKNLIKYFLMVFLILSLFIIFLYYFVFMETDKSKANKQFVSCNQAMDEFLIKNEYFFDENTMDIEDFIDGDEQSFIEKAYDYRKNQDMDITFLAFDKNKHLKNSFSPRYKLSKENYQYIKILLENFTSKKYYSYGMRNENKKIIYINEYKNGFMVLQVEMDDLARVLNLYSKDYILTNKYGRILSKGSNIKYDEEKLYLKNYDEEYLIYKDGKEDFDFYVIREKFFTKDLFLIIFLGLCLISLIYILVISTVTKKISKKLSKSLNYLIEQMVLVSQGKIEKIKINSDDEIKYVSENINSLIDNIKKLEANNTSLKYEKKASDVKAMESQFNPHFLYNTLDIISFQMYVDKDSCQKLISNLSKILRYSINNMSFVYLDEDLEYIRLYMEIQKIKHEDDLKFNLSIDEDLYQTMVPKLFIQPILENSLKYGFANKNELSICLSIYRENDKIMIEIEDTGDPLGVGRIEKLNKEIENKSKNSFLTDDHHGLENTLKRLKILYNDAKLEFVEGDNVLVRISFRGKK